MLLLRKIWQACYGALVSIEGLLCPLETLLGDAAADFFLNQHVVLDDIIAAGACGMASAAAE